jgi:cell fate (sporulation/competence/biofilm development) regulator YlbF (YheA/YmcA/DUF963 family)
MGAERPYFVKETGESMLYDAAHALARQIEQSEESREYKRLKAIIDESETSTALIKEYHRLQMALQMAAAARTPMPQDEMSRFSQLSSLLFAGTETSAFLMAEMRLQQAMADVFRIITEASGLQMELPGQP